MITIYENNKDKVIVAIEEAIRKAAGNRNSRYPVYLHEDGDVWVDEDVAGGNTVPITVWKGEAIEIASICMQFCDDDYVEECLELIDEYIDYTLESFETKMER